MLLMTALRVLSALSIAGVCSELARLLKVLIDSVTFEHVTVNKSYYVFMVFFITANCLLLKLIANSTRADSFFVAELTFSLSATISNFMLRLSLSDVAQIKMFGTIFR
jgi:hypothetical protein